MKNKQINIRQKMQRNERKKTKETKYFNNEKAKKKKMKVKEKEAKSDGRKKN